MEDSQRAKELISHLLDPLIAHSGDMEINIIEGSATVIIELKLHSDDQELLQKDEAHLLKNVQQILTVASHERKFSLELLA